MIGEGERGGGGADTEGSDQDGGEGEGGRAAEGARGPSDVLAKDVPVRGRGAGAGIGDGLEPERENGRRVGGLGAAEGEEGAEFGAILGAERGGIEME